MPTPRLQYLIDHYGVSLIERLKQETVLAQEASANFLMGSSLTPQESVLKFSLSDPSLNKSATQWLITTYLNDGFRFEDLLGDNTSKVHNTLVQFGLYRGKLPVSARSLNQYKTLADVYASIKQFIPRENEDLTLSGKALKRSEREKAHQETEFIHQDDKGLTLVSPKTEFASKWWGKGTQWCTASDNNNMFEHYNKQAPLLILIMSNGDKLQLHVGKYEVQFMDAQDNLVSGQYIAHHWDVLKSIMVFNIKQNSEILKLIPEELLDRELCLEAVKKDGMSLGYVPRKLRDRELCQEAVRQNGLSLKHIPELLRDREMCHEATRQDGMALRFVPIEFRDYEFCHEAVRQNGDALWCVPKKLLDRKFCLEAVGQNGISLCYVPNEFRDKEICWVAVKKHGEALSFVPEELQDRELCRLAVKKYGRSLGNVTRELRDRELCLEAIKQDGWALRSVPEELLDREICWSAVKQNGGALYYVPEELRDREICWSAVKQNGKALQYVPKPLLGEIYVETIDVSDKWTEILAKFSIELSRKFEMDNPSINRAGI
jgi:hypothetical protein